MSSAAGEQRPFDPSLPGTPEESWFDTISKAPEWVPVEGPLLIVGPHPDDEVFGAGGLIRLWHAAGREVTVVSVTDGEGAYPDWQGLNRVRRQELDDALRVLCQSSVTTIRLGIPDGRVADHVVSLFSSLSELFKTQTTIIAPYEADGHPDHDITGSICCDIARRQRLTIARYPIWTWHHGNPNRFAPEQWRRVSLDRATQHAKQAAMQCFVSQLRPAGRVPIVPSHVLPYFARPFEAFLL